MNKDQQELEEKAQLALSALRRAVAKAYANGQALDERTPEQRTAALAAEEAERTAVGVS